MPPVRFRAFLPVLCVGLLAVAVSAQVDPREHARREKPDTAGDKCQPTISNLERALREVLAGDPGGAAAPRARWDGKSAPLFADLVQARFRLTDEERALVAKNGFVVPARLAFTTYSWAFHELYQSQIPLYVSADAILHAVFNANDGIIADLERKALAPALEKLLDGLHAALPAAPYPAQVRRDLDLYLAVARSLLAGSPVAGGPAEATAFFALCMKAEGIATVEIFGRPRKLDVSQYTPRGHYAKKEHELEGYFRSAMWLSRLEFNLVSRSCRSSHPGMAPDPAETPREALAALALADLVERTRSQGTLALIERAWTLLAGAREDVPIAGLLDLKRAARIVRFDDPGAFGRFKAALGNRYLRTARFHPMPEGSTVLPAITTLIGPRATIDAGTLGLLGHSAVAGRQRLDVTDVAYVLGNERASAYLDAERRRFPGLDAGLAKARAKLGAARDDGSLYASWYAAIRALAGARPAGQLPTFVAGPAFADLRLNSVVAAYGQIRHNFALMAGQEYFEGGCEIPDGYVEAVPEVYDGLVRYAKLGLASLRSLDPLDAAKSHHYFKRLERVAGALAIIARRELAGRPLTEPMKRFLSMVAEMTPGSTGGPPTYNGWYFDLFRSTNDALADASFIADYHTSTELNEAAYAGATGVRLGIFVVDTGGAPRYVVGPVTRAFGLHHPLAKRLSDSDVATLSNVADPWAASYTVPAVAEPSLDISWDASDSEKGLRRVVLKAVADLGPTTVELLDHHRRSLGALTQVVTNGENHFTFSYDTNREPQALRVQCGKFQGWMISTIMGLWGKFGPKIKEE